MHMEQSLVGKVLSSWAILPPMARGFLNQVNLETGRGKIKRGLNAADPSTDHHDVSKMTVLGTHDNLSFNWFFFHFYPPLPDFDVSLNHFLDNFRDVLDLYLLSDIQGQPAVLKHW